MNEDLEVVIPFKDGHDTLPRLLASLPAGLRVHIIDDCSSRPLDSIPDGNGIKCGTGLTVTRLDRPGYFAGAVNAGVHSAVKAGRNALVLNQDVWFTDARAFEWLAGLSPRVAIAGSGVMNHPAWPSGYVQGQFMFIRAQAWQQVGELNSADYPLWGNSSEWQLRACRQGWEALPIAEVPGMQHERKRGEAFGSSIRALLQAQPDKREWFIRTPPMVSVIIPAYNYGRYLKDAIGSLIGGNTCLGEVPGQSFQSFDVWIVDDCSTDETPEVGWALADPWKGIHYIRLDKRRGTPGANNAGIMRATGRYITILCADDMMEPDRLARMVRASQANPHSVICDDLMVLVNGQRLRRWGLTGKGQHYDFQKLLYRNHMHAGIMFPRQAWNETGGYPEAMIYGREDWGFNVALGAAGYCGVLLDYSGYLYRREMQNRTERNSGPEWAARFMAQMQALYPDLYKGRLPDMCCGKPPTNGSRKTGPARGASRQALAAGLPTSGMTLLRFQGLGHGIKMFYGPVTGNTYTAGLDKPLIYVDNRDLRNANPLTPGVMDQGRFSVEQQTPVPQVPQAEAQEVNQGLIVINPADGISAEEASQAGQVLAQYEPAVEDQSQESIAAEAVIQAMDETADALASALVQPDQPEAPKKRKRGGRKAAQAQE